MKHQSRRLEIGNRIHGRWVLFLCLLCGGWTGSDRAEAAGGTVPGSLSMTEFQQQFFTGMAPYQTDQQELIVDGNNRILLKGVAVNPPHSITFSEGYALMGGNPMRLTSLSLGVRGKNQITYTVEYAIPTVLSSECVIRSKSATDSG